LYKELHSSSSIYGSSSAEFIDEISLMIEYLSPKTVLDYGCGKGAVIALLQAKFPTIRFYGYDPAIPGRDVLPVEKADMVINTDVLEHIPEGDLPDVIREIRRLSDRVYFNLHHALASAILPNGENAHCTVKPPVWYHELQGTCFETVTPLQGRHKYMSVALTFDIPPHIRKKYISIVTYRRSFRYRAGRALKKARALLGR
jgi:hypothetical protein